MWYNPALTKSIMKSEPFYGMKQLQIATKIIAMIFSAAVLLAASIETVRVFFGIFEMNIISAIQDGLFVLILLEMFYVVRSFIKYGSVNITLIISVGIVAIIKAVIFKLETLDLNTSIAFTILFLGLCIGLVLENRTHQFNLSLDRDRKAQGLKNETTSKTTITEAAEELEDIIDRQYI